MFFKINQYLSFLGLVQLEVYQYNTIRSHLEFDRKIDAIKALRAFTRNEDGRSIQCPDRGNEYSNLFYIHLVDRGQCYYEGPHSKTLGLKQAKDVIDLMIANPLAC